MISWWLDSKSICNQPISLMISWWQFKKTFWNFNLFPYLFQWLHDWSRASSFTTLWIVLRMPWIYHLCYSMPPKHPSLIFIFKSLTPFAQQTRIRASPSLTELRASRSAPAADSRSRSPSVAFANIDNSGSYEALKLLAFENPSVVHSAANTKDETLRAFLAAEVDEEKEAF